MPISVLHIAHYAASYRGNFVESLEKLDYLVSEQGGVTVYMFPVWAKESKAIIWIAEMQRRGKKVYYFSGNTLLDAKLIRNIIKENGISIIHTHFLPAKFQVAVKLASLGGIVKQIVHFHNHSERKSGIQAILRKVFYRKCVLISCSQSVHKSICRDYPPNIKYKQDNGIDTKRLEVYTDVSAEEFGFNNKFPICLMFGFDFERKGVDLACTAIQKLWEEGIKINLVISLSSNYNIVHDKIENLLNGIPEWLKIIPSRSDVASLYNSVDLFLSPSREEGLPYAALEACYSKCGVVLSDIDAQKLDIPYIVWFEEGNADRLAEAIKIGLEFKNEKIEKLEVIRTAILSKYSVMSWASGMMSIYKSL